MYRVFVRNWWKRGPVGLEPDPGARKTTIARNVPTEKEAQAICRLYNVTHPAGQLSRKAEYEET